MADVVLVYPKTGSDVKGASVDLPLSVLSVASLMVKEYEIKIIDQRTDSDWSQKLGDEVRKTPRFVGVSAMTGPQILFGLEASRIVKDTNPEVPVVWGGVHATLLPEETVRHPLVDVVVVGEGEVAALELVRALEGKQALDQVPNIVYKKKGDIIATPRGGPLDLDSLPGLPYELLDVEQYVRNKNQLFPEVTRLLPFVTSRGCPFSCTFCCNPRISHRRWRHTSAERAYEQLMAVVERFHLDGITFHDENFLGNEKRAARLANMIGGQVRWYIQGRMDSLARMDLPRLERDGLRAVQPGLESGSPRILKLIKKAENVEDFLEANRALGRTSIIPMYNFMMGFPGETYDELTESVDLALRLMAENPKAQIAGFYIFAPYPGTELYDLAVEQGFEPPQTLDGWARYNRQHLDTPWIQDQREMLENIMFSSKLVDGQRLRNVLAGWHVPRLIAQLMGAWYRRRWRKRGFRRTLDIALLDFLARKWLSW